MDSDQFDIEVPDTIPAHITRRHERMARRMVSRAHRGSGRVRARTRLVVPLAVCGILALIAGVIALWTIYPSPATFVVVPTVLLVAAVCGTTFAIVRRSGLDSL